MGGIMLWCCPSVRPSVRRHRFQAKTQKVSRLSTRNLVYSFPIGPWGTLFCFQGHKGQIWSDTHFHAITQKVLQLSTWNLVYSFPVGPKEIPSCGGRELDFQGQRGLKGQSSLHTRFHVITPKVLHLSNWILVYSFSIIPWGTLIILGLWPWFSRSHRSQRWNLVPWNITQNVMKLSTSNAVQTLVWGYARFSFICGCVGSILGCKKVKIAPMGIRCPPLQCYIIDIVICVHLSVLCMTDGLLQ